MSRLIQERGSEYSTVLADERIGGMDGIQRTSFSNFMNTGHPVPSLASLDSIRTLLVSPFTESRKQKYLTVFFRRIDIGCPSRCPLRGECDMTFLYKALCLGFQKGQVILLHKLITLQPVGKPGRIVFGVDSVCNNRFLHRLHFDVTVGKNVDFTRLFKLTNRGRLSSPWAKDFLWKDSLEAIVEKYYWMRKLKEKIYWGNDISQVRAEEK